MALQMLLGPLIASALGLGILGTGRDYLQRRDAERVRGLLGEAGGNIMGPPDEAGGMGYQPGYGLLADPSDPRRQLEYAAGIMGLPGMQGLGGNMLNQAFARLQQGQQFDVTRGDQREQFNLTRGDRLTEQERQARMEQIRLDNWLMQYQAQRGDTMFSQRLAANADRRAEAAAAAERAAANNPAALLPKPIAGYTWMQGRDGQLMQAPIRGTPDFVKATEGDDALAAAVGGIRRIFDIVDGAERTVNGRVVRAGGTGFEMFGDKAGELGMLRSQVISALGKARDLGVLQKSDYEALSEQVPDFASNWAPYKGAKARGALTELQRQFEAKRQAMRRSNPWMEPVLPEGVPPPPAGFRVIP